MDAFESDKGDPLTQEELEELKDEDISFYTDKGKSLVQPEKPTFDDGELAAELVSKDEEQKNKPDSQSTKQKQDLEQSKQPTFEQTQDERLPDTATGAWVLGLAGSLFVGLGGFLGLKKKKDE